MAASKARPSDFWPLTTQGELRAERHTWVPAMMRTVPVLEAIHVDMEAGQEKGDLGVSLEAMRRLAMLWLIDDDEWLAWGKENLDPEDYDRMKRAVEADRQRVEDDRRRVYPTTTHGLHE